MNTRIWRWLMAVALVSTQLACSGSRQDAQSIGERQGSELRIEVMSNRADLISGGDALIEIDVPEHVDVTGLTLRLNGQDVRHAVERRRNGRVIGLLEGLRVGENILEAALDSETDTVTIRNYPNEGPIFSRPEIQRIRCQESAVDLNCNQPAQYTYLYRPTAVLEDTLDQLLDGAVIRVGADLQPYDPNNPPEDVAMTTTQNGETIPFIVRQELGYQDRDEYRILTLFNPDEPWEPWAPQAQWNGKMLITHGGNCGADYQTGTAPLGDYAGTLGDIPLLEPSYIYALGKGYAVLSTALANTGHNCDVALNAESIMMAKERFVEQYGPLRYTIGTGCSGGSIVQATIANSYPGLYQGLLTMCAYPDSLSAGTQFLDLHLMRRYFEDPTRWAPGVIWNPLILGAVEGHLTHINAIVADEGLFKTATAVTGDCFGENTYHPETHPTGQRCGIIEWSSHIFGQRTPDVWQSTEQRVGYGVAGIPLGNTGVQYGLNALRAGLITPAMFVDLNVKIGGLNVDMQPVPERIKADHPAVENAYRSGMINMANNLDSVAIINFVGPDPGLAHDSVHAWWVRWRIEREHGSARNHVMWAGPVPLLGDLKFVYEGLDAMDRWLAAVEQDVSTMPLADKISRHRPGDVEDSCSLIDGRRIFGQECIDFLRPLYAYGTPRTVAGDTRTADNFDCQLRPLDRNDDYGLLPFTDEQWSQLEVLFAEGVCDYRAPGKGKQPTQKWLRYRDDSGRVIVGGEQLPSAPRFSATGTHSAAFYYE